MRIALDGQTTVIQKSGFGSYVKNLVENLKTLAPEDEFILIKPENQNDLNTIKRIFWDQYTFPRKAKSFKPDIIHQPSFSAPILTSKKVVVTVHDIIPIIFPQNFSFVSRFFWTKIMPFSYRFVDHIITISQNSKKDLIEYLHIPEQKITVIPEAAGTNFHVMNNLKDLEKIKEIKQKYNITKDYILSVGTLEPRKNIPFLIKSFVKSLKNDQINAQLVLIGKKGWQFDEIFSQIENQNIKNNVILTGYVSDEDLVYLYNGAKLFVFPSLYEGFGLPILEAMSCSLPVISSNTSSLPEVCGQAGFLLDPTDQNQWSKIISKIFTDHKLQKEQSILSLDQAKKFSWDITAKKTLEVYHELLKK